MDIPAHHCTPQIQDIAMALSTIMISMLTPPVVLAEEDTMIYKLFTLMLKVIARSVQLISEAAPIIIAV
jgi:hypothetical protein